MRNILMRNTLVRKQVLVAQFIPDWYKIRRRRPIYVTVEIFVHKVGITTLDGRVNFQAPVFSAVGVAGPLPSGNAVGNVGQIQDHIRKMLYADELIGPIPNLKELLDAWQKYHLNDIRPGCVHQQIHGWDRVEYPDSEHLYWTRVLDNAELEFMPVEGKPIFSTKPGMEYPPEGVLLKECPICGYRFGLALNYMPFPASLIDLVKGLPSSHAPFPWGQATVEEYDRAYSALAEATRVFEHVTGYTVTDSGDYAQI